MSAQELCVLADGFERDAASREEQAAGVHSSFERRLGLAILAKIGKGGKLADMVKNEWDKNGDGDINKLEFRQCVRGSLSMKADGKEIDAFFASMDVDGGGSLDLSELQPMLKKLQQGAANADQEAADQRREAVALRAKAASVREVAAATSAHEQADARLRQLQQVENVGAKLGAMIVKRNMKLGEVVQKWDKDGDGTVDKREFRENVLAMGVVAKAEAIDALFDTYDSDGGGSLDMNELKPTLKGLIDTAAAAELEQKELKKTTEQLRKAARATQKAMRDAQAKEDAEAAEAAEQTRKAAEEKAAEEAEAKRLAKEAKEAKARADAEAKANFDAKIAARRAAR